MNNKKRSSSKYHQIQNAYTLLKNPQKYKGEPLITLRSSWEISFVFKFLDVNPNILEWSSEGFFINYKYSLDNLVHRYYPDFWVKLKDKDGNVLEKLIEIKPTKDLILNKRKSNMEIILKNKEKWEAAKLFCDHNNMEFIVLTEKQLFF